MQGTRYPNAEVYPPSPFKGGRAKRKGDVIPSEEGMQSWRLNTVTADRSSYRKPHLAGGAAIPVFL